MSRFLDPAERFLWHEAIRAKLSTFENIVDCLVCGTRERYGLNRACVECRKDFSLRVKGTKQDSEAEILRRLLELPRSAEMARVLGKRFYFPRRCKSGHLARWRVGPQECERCLRPLA